MKRFLRITTLSSAVLLIIGVGAPLGLFFSKIWSGAGAPSSASFGTDLIDDRMHTIYPAFLNSLWVAFSVGALSTILGFVFLWFLRRFDFSAKTRRFVEGLLKGPYLLPPFFLAIGWIALAAPEVGYLNRLLATLGLSGISTLYGLTATITVLTFWTTALAMIQLRFFFDQYPGQLEDAAIICGASPWRAFANATLPLARNQLLSCFLVCTVSALAAFGVPALLALPAKQHVLTTRIYQDIKGSMDFVAAARTSFGLLLTTAVLLFVQRFTESRREIALVSGKSSPQARLRASGSAKVLLAFAICFGFLSMVLPCVAIVIQSLLRDPSDLTSITFERYAYVFGQVPDGWLAVKNSLTTAIAAAALTTALGLCVAIAASRIQSRLARRLIDLWNLAYALPGTLIALGLAVFYARTLADTLWILMLAYAVKYAAFSLNTLAPAAQSIGRELEEAAWMSGASRLRTTLTIVVPMLAPAIGASFFLALVPMISELTMSVFLVGPGTDTLGSLIFRFKEYADPGSASVLAVVVAGVIFILKGVFRPWPKK